MRKATRILFILASILLCSVLITTSALSTTFAKYTSRGSLDSKSARVAEWLGGIDFSSGRNESGKDSSSNTVLNSESNLQIIAPGTSGSLAKFTLKNEPEVRHQINLKVDFKIPEVEAGKTPAFGYEGFADGKDYFPLLITVNRKDGSTVKGTPLYFYMTMTDPDDNSKKIETIDRLFEVIENKIEDDYSDIVAPLGWDTATITYSVDWTWFYNDAEIDAATLPGLTSAAKTELINALKEHQDPAKDTLLGAAILNRSDLDAASAHITELKDILAQIEAGTLTQDAAMEALNERLSLMNGEPEKEYKYEKVEEYPINWRGLRNCGYMKGCRYNNSGVFMPQIDSDDSTRFGTYFEVLTGDDYVITAAKKSGEPYNTGTTRNLMMFYYGLFDSNGGNGATIKPKPGEYYEYTFSARSHVSSVQNNYTPSSFVALPFAINDTSKQPYYLFGMFQNGTENNTKSQLSAGYNIVPTNVGTDPLGGFNAIQKSVFEDLVYSEFDKANRRFGCYKITYEGIERTTSGNTESGIRVKFYYKDKTSGEYLPYEKTDGTEIALELWGVSISLGISARTRYEPNSSPVKIAMQTVELVNAKFYQKTTVSSEEDAYKNLLARAQSLVSTADSKTFMFNVNANITAVQLNS